MVINMKLICLFLYPIFLIASCSPAAPSAPPADSGTPVDAGVVAAEGESEPPEDSGIIAGLVIVEDAGPIPDAGVPIVIDSGVTICVGGPKFDPAGAPHVGNGRGQQFIGGQCLDAEDCASGCCAKPCGICSGVGAQFQAGKEGCGFH